MVWYNVANLFKKYPLGIKVVVWLILFSGLTATISSGLQSWLSYQDELKSLEQRLDSAVKIFAPALSRSLWNIDYENTKDLLDGILDLPDVYNVILLTSDQASLTVGAEPSGQPSLSKVYTLYQQGSDNFWLGDLTLIATLDSTRQLVVDRFFSTLIEQLFKTVLMAVFLLIAFRYLVSRHLEKMSRYAREIDIDSPIRAITLDRKEPAVEDELSQVVNAINNMRVRVLEQSIALRDSERQSNLARLEAIRENQLKNQFITNISHELRTPMDNIVGLAESLLDSKLTEQQREYVAAVQKNTDLLMSMLNDMLDLSKLESGTLESHSSPLEIRALLQEAKFRLTQLSSDKEIRIETYLDADLPRRIAADYRNLLRILESLLSVAICLAPMGHIAIHVQPVESIGKKVVLRFSVEDNGPGMEVSEIEKILTNTYDFAVGADLPEVGISLKIAVAKELIELLGGQFGIETEPGRGTTFWFETDAELRLPENKTGQDQTSLQCIRILVADANESSLQETLELFTEEERECIDTARSTAQVFTLLSHAAESLQFYDAFIIDDHMDSCTNTEIALLAILRGIRREPEHSKNPIIVVTKQPNNELMKKVHLHGASAYISKMERNQNLREIVFSLLSAEAGNLEFVLSPSLMMAKEQRQINCRQTSILLVEDNNANRDLVGKMLEKCGCRVTMADNGQQAIARLSDESFDIIFMDCWMPVMDGYEATKRIRSSKQRYAKTPIIALTANAFAGEKEKCLQMGMNRLLTKPVRFEDLTRIVKQYEEGMLMRSDESIPEQ